MGLPIQPWTERLRALVEEGPVPFDKAMAEMSALVPPGRAYRDAERVVEWVRTKHQYKSQRETLSDEDRKGQRVRAGQRRIARSAIWTQCHHGRVEEYAEGDVRMLRKGTKGWPVEAAPEAS